MWRLLLDPANALTTGGLASGLVGVCLASSRLPDLAVALLMFAILVDQVDGPVARRTRDRAAETAAFGKELDSLCDVVTLGIGPMILVATIAGMSWGAVVIGAALCLTAVIRIAAFNCLGSLKERFGGLPLLYTNPLLALFLIVRMSVGATPREGVLFVGAAILGLQWCPMVRIPMLQGWMYPAVFAVFAVMIGMLGLSHWPGHP